MWRGCENATLKYTTVMYCLFWTINDSARADAGMGLWPSPRHFLCMEFPPCTTKRTFLSWTLGVDA